MENEYRAIVTFDEKTYNSASISNLKVIGFTLSENEDPESKLEKTIKEKYLSKPNHKIVNYHKHFIYKISEEIKIKDPVVETELKKIYEN